MNNLAKFDVTTHLGTELEEESQNTLMFCKKCLTENIFPQEDYKELCQLTVLWLGGVVDNFQFQWPGPVHHARFMAKAIYYLKMQLTSRHVAIFTESEKVEISLMAEFVGVFTLAGSFCVP